MTLRMVMATMAMAALALMISGVVAAHAAVQNCSIYPERCQYGANGVYYFYPNGYRMPPSTGAPASGSAQATTRAAWGCGATDGTARGRSWGFPNRASASLRALSECAKRSTHCHIVSCSPSIHNYYEAQATLIGGAHR
jgi:hypothetical protein